MVWGRDVGSLTVGRLFIRVLSFFFLVRLINVEWGDLDALMVLVHGKICVCVFGMK